MTREQIKTLLPVINAFSEGKSVQIKRAGAWIEKDSLYFDEEPENYRIKPPAPQFRPWTAEEFPHQCVLKHPCGVQISGEGVA